MGTFLEYLCIGVAMVSAITVITGLLARAMFWNPISEDVNPFDQPRRSIEQTGRDWGL